MTGLCHVCYETELRCVAHEGCADRGKRFEKAIAVV